MARDLHFPSFLIVISVSNNSGVNPSHTILRAIDCDIISTSAVLVTRNIRGLIEDLLRG